LEVGIKIFHYSQAPVAHACNPSYLGGRDQEDQDSNSAQANSLRDPNLKYPIQNRAGGVAQVVTKDSKFGNKIVKKKATSHIKTNSKMAELNSFLSVNSLNLIIFSNPNYK
jgi:hypothetical protein